MLAIRALCFVVLFCFPQGKLSLVEKCHEFRIMTTKKEVRKEFCISEAFIFQFQLYNLEAEMIEEKTMWSH